MTVPRRTARIGLALVVLIIFSLVLGMSSYWLSDHYSATTSKGQEHILLPSPVTFIVPTVAPAEVVRFSASPDDDPARGRWMRRWS